MNQLENIYKEYFEERFISHGDDIKTLWNSTSSQEIRFKILQSIGDLEGSSILDVGCGFGDFYGYLKKNNITPRQYLGIDICEDIIKLAKKKYNAKFLTSNLNDFSTKENYDYVIGSGIFFMKTNLWFEYLDKQLRKMYLLCTKGIGINFLSSFSQKMDAQSYYANPSEIISYVQSNISPKVVLRHDYKENDFTIFIYK